jgi:hypothetical protein
LKATSISEKMDVTSIGACLTVVLVGCTTAKRLLV